MYVRSEGYHHEPEQKERVLLNLAQLSNLLVDESTADCLPLPLAFHFTLAVLRHCFRVDTEEVVQEDAVGMIERRLAFRALNRVVLALLSTEVPTYYLFKFYNSNSNNNHTRFLMDS
jgi:hypothetical protein